METQPAPNLDPVALLQAAPEDEYALVELRLDWPFDLEIYPRHKQLWLRMFVITQDPLYWVADRGEAWTAVTVDEQVLEIDVYLTLDALRRGIDGAGGDLGAAVGRYASAVMRAGLKHEDALIDPAYPDRAARGEAPRLLEELDAGGTGDFGIPEIQVRRSWAPLGLGALTDLVQHSFGAIDLDRSNVRLDAVDAEAEECPACKGHTFGFPSMLEEARESMCAPHQTAARALNAARLARARESNFAGWRAVDKAAMRINKLPEPAFNPQPPRVVGEAPARNDPCPCGSGKKYKRCHGA